MNTEETRWRIIDDFAMYAISNTGIVKRLSKDRALTPTRKDGRYPCVTLSINGVPKRKTVHRLVAQAFVPNPENKPEVNHIDFNIHNNHASNLEWCTRSENILHSVKAGRKPGYKDAMPPQSTIDNLKKWHKEHGPWNKGKRTMQNVVCVCGKEFYPGNRKIRFCSKSCGKKGNTNNRNHPLKNLVRSKQKQIK